MIMARGEIYLLAIWKMDDSIDCFRDFCVLTLAAGFTGYLYAQTAGLRAWGQMYDHTSHFTPSGFHSAIADLTWMAIDFIFHFL